MLLGLLVFSIFVIVPCALIVFWIVTLCQFLSARRRVRAAPDAPETARLPGIRTRLIVLSVIVGVYAVFWVTIVGLFMYGLAHM